MHEKKAGDLEIVLILGLALVSVLFVLAIAGAGRFARLVYDLESRLGVVEAPRDVSAGLPAAVRDFALRGDAAPDDLATRLSFTQSAEFQPRADAAWIPLEARQTVAVGAAGFVWEAWQDLGPLPKLRVVDAYVAGQGQLTVRLFGMIPAGNAEGPETDRAEAMRYLAELPWAPDAILGNPALRWRMDADEWAEVSMPLPDGAATVRFRFDEAGDIVEMRARDRPATDADGKPVRYDWKAKFRDYRMIGPRRIPAEGEVGYIIDGTYRPYFQGRITGYEAVH